MKFIIKKIATLFITLILISFLSFLAFSFIPGDAALSSLGLDADEVVVEALREELGLNRPIPVQYADWLCSALQGDFGESTQYHLPVKQLVAQRLPVTITLALYAMSFVVVVAFPLGLLGARKPEGVLDTITRQTIKNLSGVIFVFCGSIFALTGRRGRRPLQGGIQLPYEKEPFASAFFCVTPTILNLKFCITFCAFSFEQYEKQRNTSLREHRNT